MEPSAVAHSDSEEAAAAQHHQHPQQEQQPQRARRRRRRGHGPGHGGGVGEHQEHTHEEEEENDDGGHGSDDGGAFWSDEDGDGGAGSHHHDSQQPPPSSPPPPPRSPPAAAPQPSTSSSGFASSSPLRPLQIDSPNLRRARESGSASPLTPGRSPSRRRQERRLKAAAGKAARIRKRLLVTIFLLGALVGAFWFPRLFPNFYARWMIPLPAFNVSSVIPAAIADVNSTILNDVWGTSKGCLIINQSIETPGSDLFQTIHTHTQAYSRRPSRQRRIQASRRGTGVSRGTTPSCSFPDS